MFAAEVQRKLGVIARHKESWLNALASGYLHGTAAAIQGLIRRCLAESAESLTPVLTGSYAPLIARYVGMDVRLRPDLTLEGLATLP
jgi:type III pantothenate kinase